MAKKTGDVFREGNMVSNIGVGREITVIPSGACVTLATWQKGDDGLKRMVPEESLFINGLRWRVLLSFLPEIDASVDEILSGGQVEPDFFPLGGPLCLVITRRQRVEIFFRSEDIHGNGDFLIGRLSLRCEEWKNLSRYIHESEQWKNLCQDIQDTDDSETEEPTLDECS